MKRDPRVDPKAGDELRVGEERRMVMRISHWSGWFDVYYCRILIPIQLRKIRCNSDTWRKWAKDAEVIHVAE